MLPNRSKRFAAASEEIPRLVLTTPWQIALIAVMVLALLVTIFPQKALVNTLYDQNNLDPLTLSYIQNLYRAETSNMDVALLLARTQKQKYDLSTLEPTLLNAAREGTDRQRQEAYSILFEAYQYQRTWAYGASDAARAKQQLTTLLLEATQEDLLPGTTQTFALAAFDLELKSAGGAFIAKLHFANPVRELEDLGALALSRGQYRAAAQCFLLARQKAQSRDEARRLFQKGIDTYMAASLFAPALQAAADFLGDLDGDLPTLRFLSRASSAAGNPVQAAFYARQLVYIPNGASPRP